MGSSRYLKKKKKVEPYRTEYQSSHRPPKRLLATRAAMPATRSTAEKESSAAEFLKDEISFVPAFRPSPFIQPRTGLLFSTAATAASSLVKERAKFRTKSIRPFENDPK